MFAHGIESQRIDIYVTIYALEKTTSRTHILDNEMFDAEDDVAIVGRQHALLGRIAKFNGD